MVYSEQLAYVKECLIKNSGYYPPDPQYNFRCKYDHIVRVLRWCHILAEDIPQIDRDILYTAAIFHDVGYSGTEDNKHHAERSAALFAEYAEEHGMGADAARKIEYVIRMHSNKELLRESGVMPELVILMEADLMDEEGALRIVWYTTTKGILGADSYQDLYDYIQMGSKKRLENPMTTPLARKLWQEKTELVDTFSEKLLFDISEDISFLQDKSKV